jgi:MOSC domain-containing protein YiiM
MRVISVNVGLPRPVRWRGRAVTTAIFKEPVAGRLALRRLNLAGDAQADLTVHGGRDKAVYAYPAEHYDSWRGQWPERPLPWGAFGENLGTEGLREDAVGIGDEFRVGTARLVVTQPRLPCYKLGLRFDDPGAVKQFLTSGRPGIYFAVLEEGEVAAGDPIRQEARDENGVTVADVLRMAVTQPGDPDLLRRALRVKALAGYWRQEFLERLRGLDEPLS